MAISILERSPNILMPEVVDRYLEEVGQNGHLYMYILPYSPNALMFDVVDRYLEEVGQNGYLYT